MHRQKVLVGYKTDLTTGTVFVEYRKEIVEDDGSITNDGTHRETITNEDYDKLKKLKFADEVLIKKAESLNKLAKEIEGLKKTNNELFSYSKSEIEKRDSELKKKESEIEALKKAKK